MREIIGRIVQGHQVASGRAKQDRFPGGTIAMQAPFFLERGLDLSDWHHGTLNVSIFPLRYEILHAPRTFRLVKWHPVEPPEDFSFFDGEILEPPTGQWVEALLYFPHPETKPEHLQPPDVIEIIARRRLLSVPYGAQVRLRFQEEQIRFQPSLGR